MSIGSRIYEFRKANNMSQEALAEQLEVSRQSVSKWETDTATPELDKLLKMCDIFEISLDELVGRQKKEARSDPTGDSKIKASTFTLVKTVGCILLALSLIGSILAFLFAKDSEILFIFLLTILVCGFICLFGKQNIGYWCAWVIAAPFHIFPFYIIFLKLNIVIVLQIIFYLVMIATVYKRIHTTISIQKIKTIIICIGWSALGCLCMIKFFFLHTTIGASQTINLTLFNSLMYFPLPFLLTYTVSWIATNRKKKGHF